MVQITHRYDATLERRVQVVSACVLRQVLDEQGSDYARPDDWEKEDEWDVEDD